MLHVTRKVIVALLLFSRLQACKLLTDNRVIPYINHSLLVIIYTNHRLYQVNGYRHLCVYVYPIACINLRGRFMEIHFVSLRFELGLGKNLFNDSRLVVDSEPIVALHI